MPIYHSRILSLRGLFAHRIWCIPDSKVHGANMGPIWGRQDPGGPHIGPMNFAIWDRKLFRAITSGLSQAFPIVSSRPHYSDVIMSAKASQITGVWIVHLTVCSGANQRDIKAPRHWPLCGKFTGDQQKGSVTRKMFSFDDVITANDAINGSERCVAWLAPSHIWTIYYSLLIGLLVTHPVKFTSQLNIFIHMIQGNVFVLMYPIAHIGVRSRYLRQG